jgi:hypothetical protein
VLPSSIGNGRKRENLCPPPVIRSKGKKDKRKHLDTYTDALDKYIQAFISVIQTFELT